MFPNSLKEQLINVHTYAVTPFQADDLYAVDHDAFARNLEFLVSSGMKVVAVGGGWGTLSEIALARKTGRVVIVLGRAPADLEGLRVAPDAATAAGWAIATFGTTPSPTSPNQGPLTRPRPRRQRCASISKRAASC